MPDSRPKAVEHGAALGVNVEIVTKDPQVKGFSVVKRRSIVERTPGWLMQHRRNHPNLAMRHKPHNTQTT